MIRTTNITPKTLERIENSNLVLYELTTIKVINDATNKNINMKGEKK